MLQPLFWFHPGNSRACLLFLLCVLVVHSKESDRKDPVSSALGSDLVPYLQQSFPYWAKSTPDIPTEPSIFQIPHIQTDRSIYKPGEVVFYRVVIVDSNKENMVLDSYLWGNMQITSPKGAVLHEEGLNTEAQSTAFNYWKIPADSPGGEYTLKATFGTTAERKFTVRNYRNPNIMINIEFTKQGYGPGDTATAIVTAKRAEGGKLSNSKISIIANIDGQEVSRQDSTFDGIQSIFHFEIPQSIIHGDGNLNVIVQDGGIVESKTETIPLITHSVDVGLFPEGGVLVSEVNNTVYFEVKSTINQEPVDSFKADLCELESDRTKCKVVIQRGIAALHEGRGMFTLVPKFGTAYALLILKPTVPVSNNLFSLPIIQQHGGVIHATKQVYQEGDAISFDFGLHLPQSNSDRKFSVSLYKRDQEISNTQILVPASEAIVTKTILFTPPQHYRGVLRATAFYLGVPIAERLVFKRQSGKLNIELTPISNQTMYTPGSKVEFQIRTTDEHGDPVSAVIGVSAVDETVLSMVPKRKRVPKLEESAFLENEVQEFMAGAEYMSNDLAINLLLGTQGWRRFIHFNTEKFLEDYEVKGQRILQPPRLRSRGYSGSGSAGDARVVMEDLDLGFQIPVMARMHKQLEDNEAVVYLAADNVDMPVLDADDHTEVPQVTIEFEDFDTVVQSYITIASTRRYAHETKPRKQDSSRFDFTQTLFWDAALVTSTTGLATVSFSLSDSITTVKVMADGMALQDGQTVYGSSETSIRSIKPFYVDMQVPLECTAGDQVDAPVYFVNGLPITLRVNAGIDVQGQSISLTSSKSTTATLYSEVRDRQSINFQAIATNQTEKSAIYVQATATDPQGTQYSDTIIRTIPVTMPGFPVSIAKGGFLEPSKEVSITLTMPDDIIDNSAHTSLYLYPTPVASLTAALESLLREPYGCFEQLSSTIYPMVMAQQYFKTHSHVDPLLIKKADTLIASGYSKLLGYETSSEGFEWFGQSPAHESLTAYGLLEFTDMATVYAVDEEVMQRTKQWVLDSREGEGFKRNSRALDTFGGAPEDITNAYIVYSMLNSGIPANDLQPQINRLKKLSETSTDPYFLGLVTASLYKIGDSSIASHYAKQLAQYQDANGAVIGAETSITRSSGEGLAVETTSIAVLSWLNDEQFAEYTEKAIHWLTSVCKNGRFGSTQGTILALKAIIAYDQARTRTKAPGVVSMKLDDKLISSVSFEAEQQGQIVIPDFGSLLKQGQTHTIKLYMEGGMLMPYSVNVDLKSIKPNPCGVIDAQSCQLPIKLTTKLANTIPQEGEITQIDVTVSNTKNESTGMVVAIIGIPSGFDIRHDKLDEFVKSKTISFFETHNREVVLYWRGLAPLSTIHLALDVTASIPGRYTGPSSRAYLYYGDEFKDWQDGLTATIVQKKSSWFHL